MKSSPPSPCLPKKRLCNKIHMADEKSGFGDNTQKLGQKPFIFFFTQKNGQKPYKDDNTIFHMLND